MKLNCVLYAWAITVIVFLSVNYFCPCDEVGSGKRKPCKRGIDLFRVWNISDSDLLDDFENRTDLSNRSSDNKLSNSWLQFTGKSNYNHDYSNNEGALLNGDKKFDNFQKSKLEELLLGYDLDNRCSLTRFPSNSCIISSSFHILYESSVVINTSTCNSNYDSNLFGLPPNIKYTKGLTDKYYMLLMISNQTTVRTNNYFAHWIINNILGDELTSGSGNLQNFSSVLDYMGPFPTIPSSDIVVKFFLYSQLTSSPLAMNEVLSRNGFDEHTFFSNQPAVFCGPIAAVQFKTFS